MLCLENSAFSDLETQFDGGFRLFNKFAVFLHSHLQNILPDQVLGSASDWDKFLYLELEQPGLPFKTASEFVLNEDFHNLVLANKFPRPSKFVEQSIDFCKTFCKVLLEHEIINSNLARGLFSFDYVMMVEGPEDNYIIAVEKLSSCFVATGWISPSNKVKADSQYRSFVTFLRASAVAYNDEWVQFLSSHYGMHCRPGLMQLFRYSCLCLPPKVGGIVRFEIPTPNLPSDREMFQSCITNLQFSYLTVPNLSRLFRDQKSVVRVFRLLGRGLDLLSDKNFSIWDLPKGSVPRRTALRSKLECSFKRSVLQLENLAVVSDASTPSISRSTRAGSSSPTGPSLGRLAVSIPQCSVENSSDAVGVVKPKSSKAKKN